MAQCYTFFVLLINTYHHPIKLFVDGESIFLLKVLLKVHVIGYNLNSLPYLFDIETTLLNLL